MYVVPERLVPAVQQNSTACDTVFILLQRFIQDKPCQRTGWTVEQHRDDAGCMSRKRSPPPDGYKRKNNGEPWFIVVETMARESVSCEPLDAQTDLRTAMDATRTQMAADGWLLEKPFPYGPQFFASKDGKRVFVNVGTHHPDRRDEFMYRR